MLSVFASADVAEKAVERAPAVGIERIVVEEPGISPFGFV